MSRLALCALACLVALTGQAATRRPKPEPTKPAPAAKLADFALGKPVLGDLALADAKGKGVVIEAWGVHCPPCIASLPHLQKLSVKHKDKVVFFGAESQGSDKAAIEAVIAKAGVTYPIVSGLDKCPVAFNGIPHAFVFDGAGKLLFEGHPMDAAFEAAVAKAAATAKGGPVARPATVAKPKA